MLILLALCAQSLDAAKSLDTIPSLDTIACGSCIDERQPIPTITAALERDPDLFLLLGDNVYADSDDAEVIAAHYRTLAARPEYRRLVATTPLLATWDDHDYGRNDAGKEFPFKAASQRVFLDFFDVPGDDPRRSRPGVYTSQMLTHQPTGHTVQVVLLDTRSFRDSLALRTEIEPAALGRRGPYLERTDEATVLGADQWEWLEATLAEPADLRIVASSIQLLADGHHFEKWGLFANERTRLIDLLMQSEQPVIVLSGDRHHAEINEMRRDGRRLLELTASSLNKPGRWKNEVNPYRIGDKYHEANVGLIELEWADAGLAGVSLQIVTDRGVTIIQHDVRYE